MRNAEYSLTYCCLTFTVLIVSSNITLVLSGLACLSNPCIYGICLDDLNTTYFCYCLNGYTGIQCQTNWDDCWSSPCKNGATCIDGIANFTCLCPAGFTGLYCDEDLDECGSSPCRNNATCVDYQNGYKCNCLPGYSGIFCEIDMAVCNSTNETRCENGGECIEGPGESFSCKCRAGWKGFVCEEEVDECLSDPCQNGGICIDLEADYVCACYIGYGGKNCGTRMQMCRENICENGGLCLIEDKMQQCYCVPDFHGNHCQFRYDECKLSNECLNGGTCIDGIDNFTCSCLPNLTGDFCECLIEENNNNITCGEFNFTQIYTFESTSISTELTTSEFATFYVNVTSSYETSQVPNIESTTSIDDTTIHENATIFYFTDFSTVSNLSISTDIGPDISYDYTQTSSIISDITTETSNTKFDITTSGDTTSTLETDTWSSTNDISTITNYTDNPTTLTNPAIIISNLTTITDFTTIPTLTTLQESTISTPAIVSEPNIFTETPDITTWISTTTEELETIVPSLFDCTKDTHSCQNGGTCVYVKPNYKCVCPFNAEGQMCQRYLSIKKAAFKNNSYLSHRLPNYSKMDIEFEATTLSSDGILFYLSGNTIFMLLYIENGYLHFKFSCGYQTMLLSELKVPINNGYKNIIRTELELSDNLKHCTGGLKLNNTLSMSGSQMAYLNNIFNTSTWLYFGGYPLKNIEDTMKYAGFIGCISNLKVSNQLAHIFDDATDGFQITECSSLACLSNPCLSGGICVSKGSDWRCNCRNGYLGNHCEIFVCDNNPCLYGGTCMPFTGSGYICLCPFGKHGHFCEKDLTVTKLQFAPTIRGLSSFTAYPIPESVSRGMEIKFRFKPTFMDQISILLFVGQNGYHDQYSDHLAVSFVKGYIMLTWNLGSGPRRIFTSQPVDKNATNYLVHIGYFGKAAWLYVESLGNITGKAPGNLLQLDVVPLLYFGGHYSKNFSMLPHDLPLHTGFSGCIFDIELISANVIIPLQEYRPVIGRAVGQCGLNECNENNCQNNGLCLHHASTFMCLCQDNWYDALCSLKYNPCDFSQHKCAFGSTCVPLISDYECDCPFGRNGKYCENDVSVNDLQFTGRRSFAMLNISNHKDNKLHLELEIRPLDNYGVVFYMGGNSLKFICLSLQGGLLELKFFGISRKFVDDIPITVTNTKVLMMGSWYRVQMGIFGRKLYLGVDDVVNTKILNFDTVDFFQEIAYLGGLPDMSHLPQSSTSFHPTPFRGCLRQLRVNSRQIPLTQTTLIASRNVDNCNGSICGKDACFNGGTCWIDSFSKSHCMCASPYYGDRCELIPDCHDKLCQNRGQCDGNRCSCKNGYGGLFCENELIVRRPEFYGTSHLVIRENDNKKRNIIGSSMVHINFTSIDPDGLILWSRNNDDLFGVGVENGFLKLFISVKNANLTMVEVLPHLVTDGLWHSFEVDFLPLSIKFDGISLEQQIENRNVFEISFINDVYYVGNIPTNRSLVIETDGLFSKRFKGCIDTLSTNPGRIIKDFTRYEGNNIGICSIP